MPPLLQVIPPFIRGGPSAPGSPAVAHHWEVVRQPVAPTDNQQFSVMPQVQAKNQYSGDFALGGVTVTMTLKSGATGAIIGTATAVTNAGGLATFGGGLGFHADVPPGTVVFTFSGGTITAADSNSIVIGPRVASGIRFTVQPAGAVDGAQFGTRPQIQLIDQYGVDFSAILTGGVFGVFSGGSLIGTTTFSTNSSGHATANATMGVSGTGTTILSASIGGLIVLSDPFEVTAGGGGLTHPNEGAGKSKFFEWNAATDGLPGRYATTGPKNLGANRGQIGWGSFSAQAPALSSPATSPQTLDISYPNGLTPGDSPNGFLDCWKTVNEAALGTQEYSEFYEDTYFRIGDGSGYQNQALGTKIFGYWGVGDHVNDHRGSFLYSVIPGSGSVAVVSSAQLNIRLQGIAPGDPLYDWSVGPNVGGAINIPTDGSRVRFEIRCKINDIGVSNGTLEIWINGTKCFNYTDRRFRSATFPAKWFFKHWDPVWGGTGGGNRTRVDHLRPESIYLSGKL